MTTQRGQDGLLILGGELVGTALARAAYATGVSEIAITGGGSTLTGVVMVGDIFTIASGTEYTVSSSFKVVSTNAIATVPFSPALATAVASNATVSFETHSVAEIRVWTLDPSIEMIEDTVKGDKHKTFLGGQATHRGSATAWLDGGDEQQAALIAEVAAGTPDGTIAALAFRVAAGKFLYGAAVLSGFRAESPEGSALVPVTFDFQITGQLFQEWN